MQPSRKTLTALLIDDDSAQAFLLSRLIGKIDWLDLELIHHSHSDHAWPDLLTEKADLVFLDHHLGEGKTGLEILRSLRDFGFDGPIVMLTGRNDQLLLENFWRFGADAYIDKADLDSERISEAIQVALRLPHKDAARIFHE